MLYAPDRVAPTTCKWRMFLLEGWKPSRSYAASTSRIHGFVLQIEELQTFVLALSVKLRIYGGLEDDNFSLSRTLPHMLDAAGVYTTLHLHTYSMTPGPSRTLRFDGTSATKTAHVRNYKCRNQPGGVFMFCLAQGTTINEWHLQVCVKIPLNTCPLDVANSQTWAV